MKGVHSRETLRAMDRYPFEDEVLERLTDTNGKGGVIYLLYQCICRYMNAFARKYEVPTVCDVEKILLTKQMILKNEGICEFFEEAEYNSSELLYGLAAYCDWDYLCISEDELREADLDMETEESFKEQLERTEIFTEKAKRLLAKMFSVIETEFIYESNVLYILSIRGLSQYLRYQKSHPEMVREHFQQEDYVIHNIVEDIKNISIRDFLTDCHDNGSDEFLLGWMTGSDGYTYNSIAYLNPNWLISMYVLHGLLEHAQAIFGYQTGGDKET